MPAIADQFSITEFLAQEREKDLLRFSTAGSVDDGKSTLIGRLLYDTQSVYDDQVRSIEGKGTTAPGVLDFALLTDGLRAEREQGITIDVAYRYFSTPRRKFIIADTPGHEQYTRNMATGSSTADATVVLIDASKGVLVQSRRHAYIASLLRVRHLIVAVNKMDLIGYDEAAFRAIELDFRAVLDKIATDTGNQIHAVFVPVSALKGDNIVHRAAKTAMPWYAGPSLLELLESLPPSIDITLEPFRFPVQRVTRPDHTFRGFAGQIASGTVRTGDSVVVQPSGRTAIVDRIVTWDGDLEVAQAPLSITLVLDRELDISRGDLIAAADEPGQLTNHIKASLVWMDQRPLELNRRYLLKHASHLVPAVVASIEHRTNVATLEHEPAETLEMNAIGVVNIALLRPAAFDRYALNRTTGALILIDSETNGTVAAGMVTATSHSADDEENLEVGSWGPVTAGEREERWGHRGAVLELAGPAPLVDSIERSLFTVGVVSIRFNPEDRPFASDQSLLSALMDLQVGAGFLVLLVRPRDDGFLVAKSEGQEVTLESGETMKAVSAIHQLLHRTGFFTLTEQAGL
jgi:sulfate adenylyltransferase large subunit